MVLSSISDDGNLCLREPATQVLVGTDNPGRCFVVMLPSFAKSRVVIGCRGVNHIGIDIQLLSQLEALADDHIDVVSTMCFVEIVVSGQYLCFDVML